MHAELPEMTQFIFSLPASAYWANACGLGAALILLEAFAANRKTVLFANTLAMVLFLLGIVIVGVALRLPWFSLFREIQK